MVKLLNLSETQGPMRPLGGLNEAAGARPSLQMPFTSKEESLLWRGSQAFILVFIICDKSIFMNFLSCYSHNPVVWDCCPHSTDGEKEAKEASQGTQLAVMQWQAPGQDSSMPSRS